MIVLNKRVLVKLDDAQAQTAGGLFIPDDAKEKATTGVVETYDPGRAPDVCPVGKGDKVLFNKYAGIELPGDKTRVLVEWSDLLAVLS